MPRSRSFVFTINNYTDDDLVQVWEQGDEHAKYMIVGFEVGEQGTPHMQGYVYYDNAREVASVRSLLPRAHLDIAKGSPKQNRDYCIKDGNYEEFGSLPECGKITWERMLEIYKNPQEAPHLYNQYRKTVEAILQKEAKQAKKETKFYVHSTIHDSITEIIEYFGIAEDTKLAVVTKLEELEGYEEYEYVILFADNYDVRHYLWSRGAPISYKEGYLCKVINPQKLIIVSDTPKMYNSYKLI